MEIYLDIAQVLEQKCSHAFGKLFSCAGHLLGKNMIFLSEDTNIRHFKGFHLD